MTAEPGKLVGGKYRLEKPLARGGMGSVWLARHTELDAPAAVKFMAHELVGTPAAEARFKREAKAAAQLRSPHVVHIHDYGVEDGAPFMVMELLEGEDLAGEIARAGRLPVGRVAAIVAQVAKALSLAHAAGIVHRDLKPSNLFLSRSGEDEIVKVLDFGVAKETMPTLVVDKTTSGVLIGSPQYMSPEQARGEPVDLRSDLWSLGVVAFEALTGRPPFESTHLGALLAKISDASPAAPTSIAPELPEAVDAFIRRALARRPEDRFPSAKALADALLAIASAPESGAKAAVKPITIVPAGAAIPRSADTASAHVADTAVARDADTVHAGTAIASDTDTAGAHDVRAAIARDAGTLPATAEPDPVSTTMPEQPLPRGDGEPGRKRAPIALAVVAGLAVIGGALWLGLGPRDATGTGGNGEPAQPATGSSTTATVRASAPPAVEPAGPASAGSSTTSATAAVSTAAAASTTAAPSATAAASTTAAPSATAAASTKSPAASSAVTTPGARPTGAPAHSVASSAKPVATAAPATAAPATAAPAATPAYDPVFGLPAQKP